MGDVIEEKMEQLDFNTKKFKRSFIFGITTLPIVLVITLMVFSRNPSFSFFQGFNGIINSSSSYKNRDPVQNESTTASAPAPAPAPATSDVQWKSTPTGTGSGDVHRNMTAYSPSDGVGNTNVSVASAPEDHRNKSADSDGHRNVTAPSPSYTTTGGGKRDESPPPMSRNDSLTTSRNDSHDAPSPSATPTLNRNDSISSPPLKNSSDHEHKDHPTPSSASTDQSNNKKLLDGLIPLGFDEPSCISRYTSYKYHNPSRYKPSPYLISKLRYYEHLHRRCGPYSKPYTKFVQKLSKSKHINSSDTSTTKDGQCKYFVWTAVNGLGNRMISMVSLFLYAVLTDRVFLVEFEKPMMNLFCEPFLGSTWYLPDNFPYSHHFDHLRTYTDYWRMRDERHGRVQLPSMMFVDLGHGKDVPSHPFHCDKNQEQILEKVPVLVVRTDQYIVPSLYMSKTFREELDKMFPEKETVFYHLGRYLFQPSNQVWGLITNFYDAYLAKSDQKIGLQIRVFLPKNVSSHTIMDQILSCSDHHNILPQLLSKNNHHQTSSSSSPKSISIIVTSLYPDYAKTLKKMYKSHPTINGDKVGVYQPSYEGKQKFYDDMHFMKALADMYLLSLCDMLVTSGVSTFGYVAQGLGGLKPWILEKLVNDNVENPRCYPALSMEPCNHFPPRVDCEGNKIENIAEVWKFMRPCEDWYYGVKSVGS